MFDWLVVLPNALWALIGASGAYAWRRFQTWRMARGQGAIFAGLDDRTLFVFPPRQSGGALLPRVAVEDFLAINNIISAYLLIGRRPPHKIKDPDHLTAQDKKENSLILICSSKSNSATKEAIDSLRARNSRLHDLIPYFEDIPGTNQDQIKWNKGVFPSDSFGQQGPRLDDMAIIVKAQNPWAGQHKVLIVAGIRGIGTWGAAEFLKKWWQPLYERKDASRQRRTTKQGDFAAVVSVHYEDYDIKAVTLVNVVDLDRAYFA